MTYFEMFALIMGTVIVPTFAIYMRNTKTRQDEATRIISEQVGLLTRLVCASDATVDQLGLMNSMVNKHDVKLDRLGRESNSTMKNVTELSRQMIQVESKLDSLKESCRDVKDAVGEVHRRLDQK